MSRKEDSLSFLSSIALGTENDTLKTRKRENNLTRSSNSVMTTPKKKETLPIESMSVGSKKKTPRIEVNKKRLYVYLNCYNYH